MELGVDAPGGLLRDAGDAFELLPRCLEQPLGRPEMPKQRATPGRADAVQLVEHRRLPAVVRGSDSEEEQHGFRAFPEYGQPDDGRFFMRVVEAEFGFRMAVDLPPVPAPRGDATRP